MSQTPLASPVSQTRLSPRQGSLRMTERKATPSCHLRYDRSGLRQGVGRGSHAKVTKPQRGRREEPQAKCNFADSCVPKCNLGTREGRRWKADEAGASGTRAFPSWSLGTRDGTAGEVQLRRQLRSQVQFGDGGNEERRKADEAGASGTRAFPSWSLGTRDGTRNRCHRQPLFARACGQAAGCHGGGTDKPRQILRDSPTPISVCRGTA